MARHQPPSRGRIPTFINGDWDGTRGRARGRARAGARRAHWMGASTPCARARDSLRSTRTPPVRASGLASMPRSRALCHARPETPRMVRAGRGVQCATFEGHVRVVQTLLEAHADPLHQDVRSPPTPSPRGCVALCEVGPTPPPHARPPPRPRPLRPPALLRPPAHCAPHALAAHPTPEGGIASSPTIHPASAPSPRLLRPLRRPPLTCRELLAVRAWLPHRHRPQRAAAPSQEAPQTPQPALRGSRQRPVDCARAGAGRGEHSVEGQGLCRASPEWIAMAALAL